MRFHTLSSSEKSITRMTKLYGSGISEHKSLKVLEITDLLISGITFAESNLTTPNLMLKLMYRMSFELINFSRVSQNLVRLQPLMF